MNIQDLENLSDDDWEIVCSHIMAIEFEKRMMSEENTKIAMEMNYDFHLFSPLYQALMTYKMLLKIPNKERGDCLTPYTIIRLKNRGILKDEKRC